MSARDEPRAAATSKMERFVIIINGRKPLTIITKHSILNVEAALDPPLSAIMIYFRAFIVSTIGVIQKVHTLKFGIF